MEDFNFVVSYDEKEDEKNGGIGGIEVTKITPPIMYSFEKTEVIKRRAKQIEKQYKSTIEDVLGIENITKSSDIAAREFKENKLPPYTIKRIYGNSNYEVWRHSDFRLFPK